VPYRSTEKRDDVCKKSKAVSGRERETDDDGLQIDRAAVVCTDSFAKTTQCCAAHGVTLQQQHKQLYRSLHARNMMLQSSKTGSNNKSMGDN